MGIKKLYSHRGYLILDGIEIITVQTHFDAPLPVGYCLQKSRQRPTLPSIFGNITKYSNITINSIEQRPDEAVKSVHANNKNIIITSLTKQTLCELDESLSKNILN